MSITRRSVLQGALLAAASASSTIGRAMARATSTPTEAILVYDSRLPQSREWLRQNSRCAIDIAREHATLWRTLRLATPRGRVIGLTAWSDLVLARGLLEEKGLRLRAEARCGRLFYWEMSRQPA